MSASGSGTDSIPTTSDRTSHRPTKRVRPNTNTPSTAQAASLDALFAHPEREVKLPSTTPKRGPAPPPEIVTNVQGSSAGAGSGEFHVYKASRRREYERLRVMDSEMREEKEREEFERMKEEKEREDEERTRRKREKRGRRKAGKEKGRKEAKDKGDDEAGEGAKDQTNGEGGATVDAKKDGHAAPPVVKVAEGPGLVIHDDD